ncbi:hypothetical protein J6O48_07735 [bacterium]|nr:hypothetical protein [bacterium]
MIFYKNKLLFEDNEFENVDDNSKDNTIKITDKTIEKIKTYADNNKLKLSDFCKQYLNNELQINNSSTNTEDSSLNIDTSTNQ